ncbi:hypothetical protein [Myroides odoratus]|uniref:Uncharacterized protein n=1 Tax=Myroides odoratus TaxID=256 RepID=A0A378RKY0_MYROD|nr:hypothetical protein [Myroides odoratus]QQU02250.1 hypothetical protein I6I89_10265 [Myroides odoratus]STZ26827.1 Uncharacterised protein [Myroides odoratus]
MKKTIITLICLTTTLIVSAQDKPGVGIGGKKINKAAMLDIQATNKGVLIPRIDLEATTVLQGGVNPEGVIVYNKGRVLTPGFYYWNGEKWEMLTGDNYIADELAKVEERLETQITNIINGGGEDQGTDISYLVSFNPETNVFTYLKPNADGGYDKTEIDFTQAVQGIETNTFMREVTLTNSEGKEVVSGYVYFSEDVIKAWKVDHPEGNPVLEMDNDLGTRIDVLGVVNNNFKDLFESETNTTIIHDIIKNAPNNVWVDDRGEAGQYLMYIDENETEHEVNLTQQETQTQMFKHVVSGDGNTGEALSTSTLNPADLKDGGIYYSYQAEHGQTFYINMTNDVINSIQNSETLKKEIFNTVNEYNSTGGNVYYGKMDASSTEDVLYVIQNDVPQQIDISQDILKVIEDVTNNTIIDKILERTEVTIKIDDADVAVGTSIDGSKVYKGKRTITVFHEDGYDVTFTHPIMVQPAKKVNAPGTDAISYEPTNEKIETLLSATIIRKATKQIITNQVTDVSTTTQNQLSFSFGLGTMYTALENDEYEVVFEYTAK